MSRLIQVHLVSLQWCHSLTCNCNLIDDFKLSTQAIAPLLSFFFWYLAVRITTGHLIIDDQLLASSASYLLLIRKMFSLLVFTLHHTGTSPRDEDQCLFVLLGRGSFQRKTGSSGIEKDTEAFVSWSTSSKLAECNSAWEVRKEPATWDIISTRSLLWSLRVQGLLNETVLLELWRSLLTASLMIVHASRDDTQWTPLGLTRLRTAPFFLLLSSFLGYHPQ